MMTCCAALFSLQSSRGDLHPSFCVSICILFTEAILLAQMALQSDNLHTHFSLNMQALGEDAECPICLSPPTLPCITTCAHVYCRG
jgi:hypothetical protein